MQKWHTGDHHFEHANIIKYCNRPYRDIDHMDDDMIRRHNERVKPNDVVYYHGDFKFKNSRGGKIGEGGQRTAQYYIDRMNGRFVFICGNHDRNNSLKTNIERVVVRYNKHLVNLVHRPIDANGSFKFNFVGHIHNAWKFKKFGHNNYLINVGVDVWNFYPIRYEEIMREFNKWIRTKRYPNETYKRGDSRWGNKGV